MPGFTFTYEVTREEAHRMIATLSLLPRDLQLVYRRALTTPNPQMDALCEAAHHAQATLIVLQHVAQQEEGGHLALASAMARARQTIRRIGDYAYDHLIYFDFTIATLLLRTTPGRIPDIANLLELPALPATPSTTAGRELTPYPATPPPVIPPESPEAEMQRPQSLPWGYRRGEPQVRPVPPPPGYASHAPSPTDDLTYPGESATYPIDVFSED